MRHAATSTALALLMPITAAAAAAQGAQADPSPVLVFFDWGKPEIGSDAAGTLDAFVADYRAMPGHRLIVSGHSDRSGSAAGNRRSATRRADAVAAYLADRGIPRSAMTIAAFGEERPLIPTADGVREPQNRRVEIALAPTAAP
jgi:outer membrane protein OmpA-like peptidoglycan-associated protein